MRSICSTTLWISDLAPLVFELHTKCLTNGAHKFIATGAQRLKVLAIGSMLRKYCCPCPAGLCVGHVSFRLAFDKYGRRAKAA